MTDLDLLGIAGLLMLPRFFVFLVSRAFCTRPAPRLVRNMEDVIVSLVGLRLLASRFTDIPPGYWSAVIYLGLGLTSIVIVGWHGYAALRLGDACPDRWDGPPVV